MINYGGDKVNYYLLNRFFTQNTFFELIDDNIISKNKLFCRTVNKYINNPYDKTIGQIVNECYHILEKNYKNEYFYKNTLLNKLLLGVHSVNTTTALSEFRISKSKADFILINGNAVVYEIKTGLDNFERLDNQIKDYYSAFKNVCVVTDENNYYPLYRILKDTPVGIYVITNRGTISRKKEPVENEKNLDKNKIFKTLRKNEFEQIILNCYDYLPNVVPVEYYKECFELFDTIPMDVLYSEYLKTLKARKSLAAESIKEKPYSLRSLLYFSNFSAKELEQISCKMDENFGG